MDIDIEEEVDIADLLDGALEADALYVIIDDEALPIVGVTANEDGVFLAVADA